MVSQNVNANFNPYIFYKIQVKGVVLHLDFFGSMMHKNKIPSKVEEACPGLNIILCYPMLSSSRVILVILNFV